MNNQDDCGCGDNTNLSILNNKPVNNLPFINQNMNNNISNNMNMNNNNNMNNPVINNGNNMNNSNNINNKNNMNNGNNMNNNNNMNNVNNMNNGNNMNNNNMNNGNNMNNSNENEKNKYINLFLAFVAALAVNEAVKYFINKSIRLNSGTSSRYIYYAVGCVGVLVLYNLC
tara:strand:- start:411 stop:923 length:513 start_codon:yes stop_codon:yes gene_type:complete